MKKGKKRLGCICIAAAMAVFAVGCNGGADNGSGEANTSADAAAQETTITIAAAASLQKTFDDTLIPMFEEQNPGIKVEGTYASSGDLQTQIEGGLEADLFMSAALSNMDTLVEEGLVDEATVVDLLKNDVVLIKGAGTETEVTSFEDITKADTIVIGDPESVPAGKYAKEILTNVGNYDEVEAKASLGKDVTEVCSQVAEGSAEVGIVYATDAQGVNAEEEKVEVIAQAEDSMMETPVIYPLGILTDTANESAAGTFAEFLQTEEALAVFEENGFTIN